MIVNILKTLPWYILGAAIFAIPSILLIGTLLSPLDVDSFFSNQYFASKFLDDDTLLEDGQDIAVATEGYNLMFGWLNIWLLFLTITFSICWTVGSHFLNIDEPGKAKFFGITWTIVSGLLIASLIITNYLILSWTNYFVAQQDITVPSMNLMVIITTIYYGLMYWVACILGTARQARSAVLFANQVPARNFL